MVGPIISMLMDVPTNPVFCPILPLIALAFANEGIRTPADLFRLRVEDPDKNHIEVPWKTTILDAPIFRSVESGKSYISKILIPVPIQIIFAITDGLIGKANFLFVWSYISAPWRERPEPMQNKTRPLSPRVSVLFTQAKSF